MKGFTFEMCQRCGERVPGATLKWTKDCHGISYRKVCRRCYEWYRGRGYDGEYYTEADENIEPDEEVHG